MAKIRWEFIAAALIVGLAIIVAADRHAPRYTFVPTHLGEGYRLDQKTGGILKCGSTGCRFVLDDGVTSSNFFDEAEALENAAQGDVNSN